MNTLENQNDTLPPQGDPSQNTDERLDFLNNTEFADIKEQLTETITNLSKEYIVSEKDFWDNIQQVTENIFSDPLYEFDTEQKMIDAQNIFLFRTEFEKTKEKNTNIKKGEQTEQKGEQTEQKEEQTEQKEEQTEQKEAIINNLIVEVEKSYKIIDKKHKPKNEKEIEKFKNEDTKLKTIIENENFKNLSPEKQNLYIQYRYTGEQIAKEALTSKDKSITKENYEFIQKFNKLDTNLGLGNPIDLSGLTIIEEIESESEPKDDEEKSERSIKDMVYDEDLWSDLTKFNADIEDFVSDEEISTITLEEIQKNKNIGESIEDNIGNRYKEDREKAVNQLLNKNKLEQYKENFDEAWNIINEENIPEADLEKLQKIQEKITEYFTEKVTEKITEDTNKVIKTKAVTALLQNIGQYFNIDTTEESFAIDLESGIVFDEEEMKISGEMEGTELTFYYNMQTGEIFADDVLNYEKEEEKFYVDQNGNAGRSKLPIKMPTLNTTLENAKNKIIDNIPKTLDNINDIDEYETELHQIDFDIQQKSVVAETVVEHTMAKNIALKETQMFLEEYIPYSDAYGKENDSHEYNLYKIIYTSFNRYTVDELKTWRENLETFKEKIDPESQNFRDEMIKELFSEDKVEEDVNGEYDTTQGPSIYRFLDAITYDQTWINKDYVIDLNVFWNITNQLTKEEGTTENLSGTWEKYKRLRNDYKTAQEQAAAPEILNTPDIRNLNETPTA